jgi:hypothetical protein
MFCLWADAGGVRVATGPSHVLHSVSTVLAVYTIDAASGSQVASKMFALQDLFAPVGAANCRSERTVSSECVGLRCCACWASCSARLLRRWADAGGVSVAVGPAHVLHAGHRCTVNAASGSDVQDLWEQQTAGALHAMPVHWMRVIAQSELASHTCRST